MTDKQNEQEGFEDSRKEALEELAKLRPAEDSFVLSCTAPAPKGKIGTRLITCAMPKALFFFTLDLLKNYEDTVLEAVDYYLKQKRKPEIKALPAPETVQ